MKRKLKWSKVTPELKGVATIDLACKAESFVGKMFWSSLGVIGIAWAFYFVRLIVTDENPIVTSIAAADLTEIEKPAMTMCYKGATKMAFAERLGNFLSPKNDHLPEEILKWKGLMMMCGSIYKEDVIFPDDENYQKIAKASFRTECDKKNGEDSFGCKVNDK